METFDSPPSPEPVFNIPTVTGWLLGLMVAMHAVSVFFLIDFLPYALQPIAFWPDVPGHAVTIFTYMFLHASWLHVAVNGGMLLAFGSAMERMVGARHFLFFYIVIGALVGLGHAMVYPGSEAHMIGASGAISGLMGYVLWRAIPSNKRRWQLLGLFVLAQPIIAWAAGDMLGGDIAWFAHALGFVLGILLAWWRQ